MNEETNTMINYFPRGIGFTQSFSLNMTKISKHKIDQCPSQQ